MRSARTRAPGRVNLIGEHTDYNDGFVLPCAIAYDTRVFAVSRTDRIVRVRTSLGNAAQFDIGRLPSPACADWSDYVRGVLAVLAGAGIALSGCDAEISGDVPIGAGLSSSASLEVSLALAFLELAQAALPRIDVARLMQRAESEFAGMRCGIMDQFTVLHGEKGHALFLDTRTLHFETVRVPSDAAIVICNTMVKHNLAGSGYNERRNDCEHATRILSRRYPQVRALRDVSMGLLNAARADLPQRLFARARHVITENVRVVDMVSALRRGDLPAAGELMYASHESLRRDYDVSCKELDVMVGIAKSFQGTFGARMTGGGFGGCVVALVEASRVQAFRGHVETRYREALGITPEFYDGTPSAGASIVYE